MTPHRLRGDIFIAGLSGQALVRLELENDRVTGEERLLTIAASAFAR